VWSWSKDYVYRGGSLLASVESTGTKHFHLDHLGTVRRITGTGTPAAVLASHDYDPFGLEATSPTQDTERMKYTGHERDAATALDYMHARHYNFGVGRFISTDPIGSQDPNAPQSWNRYAYSKNNPVKYLDPNGRWPSSWWPLLGGPVHQNAINRMIGPRPGVSPHDLAILDRMQVRADQSQADQALHAMANRGEDAATAHQRANDLVRGLISGARSDLAAGNRDAALEKMGYAIHDVQDSTSPAHEGFKEWAGTMANPLNWLSDVSHGLSEDYDPSALSPGGSSLDQATAWVWTFFEDPTKPLPDDFFDANFWGDGTTRINATVPGADQGNVP
jgi:RHS repeat-associated protein